MVCIEAVAIGVVSATVIADVSYENLVLADNPVGYWRFEESTGTTAGDSSINGFNGTYSGGVGLGSPGIAGSAASFNGVDSFVELNSGTPWGGVNELTIEAWGRIETPVVGDLAAIVSADTTSFAHLQLGDAGHNVVYGTSNFSLVEISPQLDDGMWYHYALTYDAAAIRLYIDGQEAKVGVSNAQTITTSSDVMIGRGFRDERTFNGWIDEVAIYYESLGPDAIAARYAAGIPAPASVMCYCAAGAFWCRRRRAALDHSPGI